MQNVALAEDVLAVRITHVDPSLRSDDTNEHNTRLAGHDSTNYRSKAIRPHTKNLSYKACHVTHALLMHSTPAKRSLPKE